MTLMMMALAMVLGFTQCKKEQPAPQDDNEGVRITLIVDGANNNSKVNVDPQGHTNPNYATVTFEAGDVIYVGNNGHYCGYLTHNGTYFTGTINDDDLSGADYLHFYFMGNKGTTSQPTSVSITDQTVSYPVISYAHSEELYRGAGSYTAKLKNYCAIVKFKTTDIDADITITGMKNTVAVNFGANNAADGTGIDHNPYTPGQTNDGKITLHRKSNTERWAILLPQSQVTTATASAPGYASASAFTVPAIDNNQYLTNSDAGYGITMEAVPYINTNFTVASGITVKFSKGNLQYQGTNDKFRFAEHQYDYVGNAAGNTAPSASQAAWIDLFGFGTSGYNNKYPYMTSKNGSDYYQYSLLNESGKYDWGVYNKQSSQNKIENGGNHAWRTLKAAEWQYLFNDSGRGSNRYLVANITVGNDHYNGIIVFPDNYDGSIGSYTYNNSTGGWTSVSANDWSAMEALGAMFLPAAGYRDGTTVYGAGSHLSYWTTAVLNGYAQGYRVAFYDNQFDAYNLGYLVQGYSVRLVF